MKIIVNNGSLKFKVFEPKRVWNDTELKGTGSVANKQLNKTTGNVENGPNITISPLIVLSGATSIICKGADNKYLARISFFNSAVSQSTAVYHETSTNENTGVNTDFTVGSSVINSAIAAGADTFKISFYTAETNASVNVQTT